MQSITSFAKRQHRLCEAQLHFVSALRRNDVELKFKRCLRLRRKTMLCPYTPRCGHKHKHPSQIDLGFCWHAIRDSNSRLRARSGLGLTAHRAVIQHQPVRIPFLFVKQKITDTAKAVSVILARHKGFEPLTFWFVAKHSIQLS